MMPGKQPGPLKYFRLLGTGAFLTLACLGAVYLLAVGIVRVETLAASNPADPAEARPAVGDPAPDFVLKDTEGRAFRLHSQVGKVPLVIQFGSFT